MQARKIELQKKVKKEFKYLYDLYIENRKNI